MTSTARGVGRIAASAALALFAAVVLAAHPAPAAPQSHPVEIDSNVYTPHTIRISPGDTVVWTAVAGGHTVEADDGRFNFYPQRFIDRGETVSFTFLTEETVRFHCRVHGADGGNGMAGTIIVGAGSPEPEPEPPPVVEHRWVPAGYATIGAALAGITAGGVVHLAPGVYAQSVTVETRGVSIVGEGASPGDVVIDGGGVRRTGVLLAARGASLRNVTVTRHLAEGVAVRGARDVRVASVVATGNGEYGILVADSTGVTVSDVSAGGHRVAGIAVKGCDECDTIVERADASANRYGVLLDAAGSVIVRGSYVHGNAAGIVARAVPTGSRVLQRGAHITGNLIEENTVPAAASAADPAVRSGVWLAGGWFDVVEGNRIRDHDYGVLVATTGVPARDARIVDNVVDESAAAGLAWDGIGANVCFAGNRTAANAEPSSRPLLAQTLYACGRPAVAGVLEPLVVADMTRYIAGG